MSALPRITFAGTASGSDGALSIILWDDDTPILWDDDTFIEWDTLTAAEPGGKSNVPTLNFVGFGE